MLQKISQLLYDICSDDCNTTSCDFFHMQNDIIINIQSVSPPTFPLCTRYIGWPCISACTIHPRISVSNTDQIQYSLVLIKIAIHSSIDNPGMKTMNLLGCSLLALSILLPNHKPATSFLNMNTKNTQVKSPRWMSLMFCLLSVQSLLFAHFCVSVNQVWIIQRQYLELRIQWRTRPLLVVIDIEHTFATFTKERVIYTQMHIFRAFTTKCWIFYFLLYFIIKKHCKEHVCTEELDIYFILSSSQIFRTGNEGLKDSQVFKSVKVKTRALNLR